MCWPPRPARGAAAGTGAGGGGGVPSAEYGHRVAGHVDRGVDRNRDQRVPGRSNRLRRGDRVVVALAWPPRSDTALPPTFTGAVIGRFRSCGAGDDPLLVGCLGPTRCRSRAAISRRRTGRLGDSVLSMLHGSSPDWKVYGCELASSIRAPSQVKRRGRTPARAGASVVSRRAGDGRARPAEPSSEPERPRAPAPSARRAAVATELTSRTGRARTRHRVGGSDDGPGWCGWAGRTPPEWRRAMTARPARPARGAALAVRSAAKTIDARTAATRGAVESRPRCVGDGCRTGASDRRQAAREWAGDRLQAADRVEHRLESGAAPGQRHRRATPVTTGVTTPFTTGHSGCTTPSTVVRVADDGRFDRPRRQDGAHHRRWPDASGQPSAPTKPAVAPAARSGSVARAPVTVLGGRPKRGDQRIAGRGGWVGRGRSGGTGRRCWRRAPGRRGSSRPISQQPQMPKASSSNRRIHRPCATVSAIGSLRSRITTHRDNERLAHRKLTAAKIVTLVYSERAWRGSPRPAGPSGTAYSWPHDRVGRGPGQAAGRLPAAGAG